MHRFVANNLYEKSQAMEEDEHDYKYNLDELVIRGETNNHNQEQIEIIRVDLNLDEVLSSLKEPSFENAEKNKILHLLQDWTNSDFNEVYKALIEFDPKTFEEFIWLHKCVCAVFLIKGDLFHIIPRNSLLMRTYLLDVNDWDANPVHIHVICKSLWEILKDDTQVVYFARKICGISHTGFNVSICLAWASIFRQLNHEIKMFRFHEFHKLVEMLDKLDEAHLKGNPNFTYHLLQSISFLQNVIILRKSEEMIQTRFMDSFNYEPEDLERFRDWCLWISRIFEVNAHKEENIRDNALIYELVKLDLLHSLEDLFQQQEPLS